MSNLGSADGLPSTPARAALIFALAQPVTLIARRSFFLWKLEVSRLGRSAKGQESLRGRFCDYASTGHGGNVELKRLGLKSFQVIVLEVVNFDTQEIEQIEEAWKKKLMSRKFGLNKN
jgi:hypothetical protein